MQRRQTDSIIGSKRQHIIIMYAHSLLPACSQLSALLYTLADPLHFNLLLQSLKSPFATNLAYRQWQRQEARDRREKGQQLAGAKNISLSLGFKI